MSARTTIVSSCDPSFDRFLERGDLPPSLTEWLEERRAKRQKVVHSYKPAGGQFPMKNDCFVEAADVPMHLLSLQNARGRTLSYVGYNLYPIRGKRVLMIEYMCTDEGEKGAHLSRYLATLLMAWAVHDTTIRGVAADSINDISGRLLARYFGLAKISPLKYLDALSTGSIAPLLPPRERDQIRWAYCCRGGEPNWKHLWRTHRRIEVAWEDAAQKLPSFNAHIDLEAPGVRPWVAGLLAAAPRS